MSIENEPNVLDRLGIVELAVENQGSQLSQFEAAAASLNVRLTGVQSDFQVLADKFKVSPPNQDDQFFDLEHEQAKLVRAQRHQVEAETQLIEERIKATVHSDRDQQEQDLFLREKKAEIAVLVGKSVMWIGLAVMFVTLAFKVH